MFGDPLMYFADLFGLDKVHFRPRPNDTLNANQMKKLKKDYKKKYEKMFKEQENTEKKEQGDIVKDQRKKVRDNFLNDFFIPMRQQYEKNINKYQKLFPVKESDIS